MLTITLSAHVLKSATKAVSWRVRGVIASVICALVALGALASSAADTGFGEPLADATAVRIAELTANPDSYVGRHVKVVELVDDVCPMER